MRLNLIVAMDKNRVIGNKNKLPWNIPKELGYVRDKTLGKTIVMGRKNFESIGRVLPNRANVVLTRDEDYYIEGCRVLNDYKEVLELSKEEDIYIFGGSQIYDLFIPYVDRMYITVIDYEFAGDTFFPNVDMKDWEMVSKIKGDKDVNNNCDYNYYVYDRCLEED